MAKPVLSYIVPLFFDQKNDNTLNRVLQHYSKYDQTLLDQIHFILVDDCSPIKIKLPEALNMNITLLRITSDIRWNQGGARNLGVNYAQTEKMLMTDIDHIFPERTLKYLINRKFVYKDLFRFRRFSGLKKIASGCNLFYINKTLFTNFNGYDEIFCGNYGFEDTHFFESLEKASIPVVKLPYWLPVFDLAIDRQTEYHTLVRDTQQNMDLLDQKRAGTTNWHTGLSLNFKWEIVEEHLLMKTISLPKASLIISVYKNIPFLNAVLLSVNEQSWNDFEIIISEDGEYQEMQDFLGHFPFKHNWQHLHQEDVGWRKNKALNKAILAAKSEYLVFVDGDCILHPKFMEMHYRLSREGYILGGKRLKLNTSLTQEFLEGVKTYQDIDNYLVRNLFKIKRLGIRFPEESFFISIKGLFGPLARFRKIKELRGCNMSFYKNDILSINGFDEDYLKPAIGEDVDITWRFRMAGFKFRSVRNLAVVYHLYHREIWNDQIENSKMMNKKQKDGHYYCLNGIETLDPTNH